MEREEHSKKPIKFLEMVELYYYPFGNLPGNFDQLTYFTIKNYSLKITQLKEDGMKNQRYYLKSYLEFEESKHLKISYQIRAFKYLSLNYNFYYQM